MKKKKNEYKPHRHKNLPRNIFSAAVTIVLAYFFLVVGYSVAKPFGEVGETKQKELDVLSVTDSQQPDDDQQQEVQKENVRAYRLGEIEFESIETLEGFIGTLGDDYNMVIVPLKLKGGRLNYSSSNDGAILAEAGNDIPIADIYSTIKNKGYTPVASINTMEDNIYPTASKNAGFTVESTQKLWYDGNGEDAKPWLNPSATETKQYLTSITGEIAQAGFEYIICTGTAFPAFSENALKEIGGTAAESDRYLDLVDNVNNMAKTASDKGSELWLEIPAYDMFSGTCEVFFKPIMLTTQKYILKIDLSLFNDKMTINGEAVDFSKMSYGDKIEAICKQTEKSIYKTSFIPQINTSALNPLQKNEIKETLEKLGYDSYIM
ncbi:MAG: putative glycoside hydrolase [Porcipelethomonas sp.]